MLFNYNIEVKEIFAVVKFCYCLSYFTTAKISFTSILYLQFTHMIFIIYTLHNNYYNMLTSSRNKMYELIAGSVNCHVLPVRLGEVLCSLVDRSGNLSDCLPSSLFILSIEGWEESIKKQSISKRRQHGKGRNGWTCVGNVSVTCRPTCVGGIIKFRITENNLCQMFKLPSGMKMRPLTNQMWIPGSYPPTCWAKKWKRAFTPPPRETQAGEYEVIIPASPPPGRGEGGGGRGGERGGQMTGTLPFT